MTKMHCQSLVAYGQPLCETIVDCPSPRGSEVLVRIERCGVCHSDLHMQDLTAISRSAAKNGSTSLQAAPCRSLSATRSPA